ncbi:DEAD/DEAH box helicase [Butyrivibrio sp. NC3005]|uniref:DEAD/DEAH box helicase n=1 Tax=Butyrivibrio sp. NC3005 TaxID=1280685 RepID=UPI0003F6A711|nr:DEAD/DEAH box helicase [Butyrivibrio sp. NC3005]
MKPGLYEQIINGQLNSELELLPEECKYKEKVDSAEASRVLSTYVAELLKKKMDEIYENSGDDALSNQIEYINSVIGMVDSESKNQLMIGSEGDQLLTLLNENDERILLGKKAKDINRPETSIAYSSLFTGAVREPQMLTELKKEIVSANKIDMLVSFIKWSGLRELLEELKEFTSNGGQLRVICTSYMGATDVKAVEELSKLINTEIKISYDTKRTRLHAKSYMFYRDTGFTTAYIGSSNMSNAALTSGLEWNVKAAEKDMAATIEKVAATFESYWNDREFETYDESQKTRLIQALKNEKYIGEGEGRRFVFDIRPYSYQQEILDKLDAERKILGYTRNLVVAATGCGKTVISAFDYARFCQENPGKKNRLLFVAHREEILEQSIETFRGVLKDLNFGDLWVGNHKPETLDYLFVSIQTLNSRKIYDELVEDYYDFIVVDEFHHATAPIYKEPLAKFNPQILLGLTATPERMDGEDILQYFSGRIAAEIRLPEAIDRKLLCPFQYFGVSDTVDLSDVKWARGGYDRHELSDILSLSGAIATKRAKHVVENVVKYTASIDEMKALGFCVSKEHAKFMANFFNDNGISSLELDSDSSKEARATAKKRLEAGELKVIFVVDLYNEGVDITSVNTVLFLRPTESLTIFLQQLGRGLRLDDSKDCLTVLDFIGQANKKYNYEEKFNALLSNTKHSVEYELKKGFVSVPKGCYIHLEKKAREYVLQNIKCSIETRNGIVSKIATFTDDTGKELTMANFLKHYRMDPRAIYKKDNFSRLCVNAGVMEDFNESSEKDITKALSRLASIDSRRLISFVIGLLEDIDNMDFSKLTEIEKRMLQMFYVTVWMDVIDFVSPEKAYANIGNLASSPVLLKEMKELLSYLYENIDFIDKSMDFKFDCPIDLHCTYSRDQLLVALDYLKPTTVREGVKWLPEKKIDVLFVTLNKSDKDYSPTTMYNDFSINETLFHWQSQSTTSGHSSTGQRYIHHRSMGSKVLLCVREAKKDAWGNTASYCVLGFVDYVKHTGSNPMNITWELEEAIPAKYIKQTKKLIVS